MLKRLRVGSGIGTLHDEARHRHLRLGDGHAGAQAGGLGRSIRRER